MTASSKANTRKQTKDKKGSSSAQATKAVGAPDVAITTLQRLLRIFKDAFPQELDGQYAASTLVATLQEVKHHLYERDFGTAFSRPELLRAYAVRWSAARGLAYINIFRDIFELAFDGSSGCPLPLKVTCLGGGAGAEVVALSALPDVTRFDSTSADTTQPTIRVHAVDIADWSPILRDLERAIISGSGSSQAAAADTFSVTSETLDLLENGIVETCAALNAAISSSTLVTLMFTLNELYSTSMAQTQKLLLDLGHHMSPGSLLLVVDSPGSYSTVRLGKEQKQRDYPMAWLMDHALLDTAAQADRAEQGRSAEGPWEKLKSVESQWFRLPDGLNYPIALENMRYQLHLFRHR